MSHVSSKYLTDYSTPDEFCFAMRCAECGEVLKSTPIKFSKSGVKPPSDEKRVVFDALYRREKEVAMERAVSELKTLFNVCPICQRTVCDHCFMICDELDMCVFCAQRLKERGEPVKAKAY